MNVSAECSVHGIDLLWDTGDWQAPSYCSSCEVDTLRDQLGGAIEWTDTALKYNRELQKVVRDLVERWDECLPHIESAEGLAFVHGWRWQGPENGMVDVIDAAREALP